MDFNLSDEQIQLIKTLKIFTEKEIEPKAPEIDQKGMIPDRMIKKMSKMGLLGMTIPKEYGGPGASYMDCILTVEQLAYSATGVWWLVAFTSSIPGCIVTYGNESQKKAYLEEVCLGKMIPSIQFTEAETGSDPRAITTSFERIGNHYFINGMKRFSTFAIREGYSILYGKDDQDQISALIVPKFIKGYSASKNFELMGSGGMEAADAYYDGVEVPVENILGEKGQGMSILTEWIADEKIQQCAACVGLSQAALDEAINFSKTRRVGKGSQSDMQGVRWMLAEMYSNLMAARWLTRRAACLKSDNSPIWMTEAAAAKVFVVPAAINIVELSRRIHGSYGYTKDYKIERIYRAIAGFSAIAVSSEINKSIVGASLVK
jgi:alkylation response protein AidB-like acyl-CoA dehydrogenase